MGNTVILKNLLRAVFYLAVQVLVLSQINIGGAEFSYINIFLYPIFLMLLPMATPIWLMMAIGFFYGFSIDVFCNTMGMHAATCVLSTYIRMPLLNFLEPQGGYKQGISPTRNRMGFSWFLRYSSLFMFIHIFTFFCVEVFTPLYMGKILMYTLPSFIISFIIMMIISFIMNPSE